MRNGTGRNHKAPLRSVGRKQARICPQSRARGYLHNARKLRSNSKALQRSFEEVWEPLQLTPNFKLAEFIDSKAARDRKIDNSPPDRILNTLVMTAHKLEIIRTFLGAHSIKVLSGYRCPLLNKAVGGSANSQHMQGEAVDFTCSAFGTPFDICKKLEPLVKEIGIDQLIFERGWVHVSFSDKPRFQVLSLVKAGTYARGIV